MRRLFNEMLCLHYHMRTMMLYTFYNGVVELPTMTLLITRAAEAAEGTPLTDRPVVNNREHALNRGTFIPSSHTIRVFQHQ